jgi:dTDP-4-dehydrorhamnose reductase
MKKKMLLFGGTGLIGSRIIQLLNNFEIYAPVRNTVDLTKKSAVEKIISETDCDVIVYAAGVTNQDFAEKNRDLALYINKEIIQLIVKKIEHKKIPVVYFSTDAVFSGKQKDRPYTETDRPSPVNYYGLTKLAGEEAVLSASNINLVLRLISVYTGISHDKLDFARITVKNLSAGKSCYGIIDQFFNPILVDTIVSGLDLLITKKISDIVHLGATDYLSNYDFTKLVAKKFSFDEKLIIQIKLKDFYKKRDAQRGKFAWLDTTLAQKILGSGVLKTNKQNINLFYKEVLGYNSGNNV